jgi:hypothetical protein
VRSNPPFAIEEFERVAKDRGWHYCYATEDTSESDPYLQMLRDRGVPITTVFGYHVSQHHTDVADPFQCPGSHPAMKKILKGVDVETWPGPVGQSGVSICQVCRWCVLHPDERTSLPWQTPMGAMKVFQGYQGAVQNPDIMTVLEDNLLRMPPWFSELG